MIAADWFAWSSALVRPLRFGAHTVSARDGRLLRISDGVHEGWGEVSPLPGFGMATLETVDASGPEVAARLRDALAVVGVPRTLADVTVLVDALGVMPGGVRGAAVGALADLAARRAGRPLWRWLGGVRGVVCANALGGALDERVVERVGALIAEGYDTIKLKAPDAPGVVEAVRALHRAYPKATWRLDANGGWSSADARRVLADLEGYGVGYVEQPIAPGDEAALIALCCHGVPVAADESLVDARSAQRLIETGGLGAVVLKPATLGGLDAALDLAQRAVALGVAVTVTSFIDSAIGRAGAAHLAAAVAPEGRHGLSTGDWLEHDVGTTCFDGRPVASLGDAPGIGVAPDLGSIEAFS